MRERATQAARAGTRGALKRLARPRSHATHVAPRSAAGAQPGARVAQPPPRVSVAHIKSGLRCATEGDAGAQRCCLTATAALRQSSRHHRAPPPLRPPRPRCPCGLRARHLPPPADIATHLHGETLGGAARERQCGTPAPTRAPPSPPPHTPAAAASRALDDRTRPPPEKDTRAHFVSKPQQHAKTDQLRSTSIFSVGSARLIAILICQGMLK